ncbi:hypothetical protein FH608_045880 [Nonomuraea phyllanthi]|uniref:Uncharacterized protein n=1 Tax=Nonomuraea phyllanthi TaxID=2219224 RepID=A0A5C4V8L9_9ACTN|nr:hypothetical protein [Nonomuraea phyllanthi]KAB8186827.1 hypothetical protein FH608_045880 [Nonomuraea phyllanthi]
MADAILNLIGSLLGNPAAWALGGGYLVVNVASCIFKPYKVCKKCNRSRETHSTIFPGTFGWCRACKGVGYRLRVGARLLGKKL